MKQSTKLFSLLFLLAFISFSSCKTTKDKTSSKAVTSSFDEDFDKFYNRFHTDSIFQLSRIVFPLSGMQVDGIEENKWEKENWVLFKTRIYDVDTTRFKVKYKKTSKTFTQKAWVENSGFSSECRFEIVNKKWHLVYFLDQNN